MAIIFAVSIFSYVSQPSTGDPLVPWLILLTSQIAPNAPIPSHIHCSVDAEMINVWAAFNSNNFNNN